MISQNEIYQEIKTELEDAIGTILDSHGISREFIYPEISEPRMRFEIEIDHARRVREFVILLTITNKEAREWNNARTT